MTKSITELDKIRVYAEDIIEFLILGRCQRNKAILYAEKIITEINELQKAYTSYQNVNNSQKS